MTLTKDKQKYIVQWLITLLIPIILYCIPSNEIFTHTLKLFLCITAFIILIVAFDFFYTAWPAILLPALYLICNVAPAEVAFGAWSNTTVWMIIGAYVLTAALEECGLLKRIAIVCIRLCGGTFTGTLFGLIFAGYALSWVTFCNHYVVMAMLSYAICVAMNTGRSKESALILFAGQIGALTVQIFSFEALYNSMMQAGVSTVLNNFIVPWYCLPFFNFPGFIITILFFFTLTKIFQTKKVKFDGAKEYFNEEYRKLGNISKQEKIASVLLILLLLYLVTTPVHGYPIAYGFMLIPYLMFIPGIKVADSNVIAKINWGVIFFISACLGIGTVGTYLNLGNVLSSVLTPILSNLGTFSSLLVIYGAGTIANIILTPAAMVSTLSAPLTQIAVDLGLSPYPFLMTLIYATDSVFLPHEIGVLLIFYGFGLMKMSDFIKLNLFKMFFYFIMYALLQIPYWYLIGLL